MQSKEIVDYFKERKIGNTTTDVREVLAYIAKRGQQRELKQEVVRKLFTATSPQGFSVAETLENYEEY